MSKQSVWQLILIALAAFWAGVLSLLRFWYD
jgi:hypothetical protein